MKAALSNEVVECFADRKWRLNNLYWIEDKFGNVVRLELNAAQEKLLGDLHYLNLILKARQMGFSTFIDILALDCCIFNDHFSAGIVADTLDNAKGLLNRVRVAYERLPSDIRTTVTITKDNATELQFSNGSGIEVGVSLRSSTKNFIHISEYGKICARAPDKAKEIKAGALNTLAPGQFGFIESTAEGRGGDFYDKTEAARRIADGGQDLGKMDYKFHFFPWWEDETYRLVTDQRLTDKNEKYFQDLLDEHGIDLDDDQKAWYAAKKREQLDDMLKEYPSTPDEAFMAAKDGAYFAKQLRALRQRGQIGHFDFESRTVVNTFWDLGVGDNTVIWLHQLIAGKHRFVGYHEHSGEGIDYYLTWLDKWRAERGARFGVHYGPHDIEHRMQGIKAQSVRDIAKKLGYDFTVVQRTPDKLHSIQNARSKFPECQFDEAACEEGLVHLENYSRDWDEKYGVWKSHPRHDAASHAADGFMTFADGWEDMAKQEYLDITVPKLRRAS